MFGSPLPGCGPLGQDHHLSLLLFVELIPVGAHGRGLGGWPMDWLSDVSLEKAVELSQGAHELPRRPPEQEQGAWGRPLHSRLRESSE